MASRRNIPGAFPSDDFTAGNGLEGDVDAMFEDREEGDEDEDLGEHDDDEGEQEDEEDEEEDGDDEAGFGRYRITPM